MAKNVYQFSLGPNCDQLLSLLAGRYLRDVLPEQQAATMAMWILMQALIDAERIMPRLLATTDYTTAEDIPDLRAFMDERVKMTLKNCKKSKRGKC